VDSKAQELRILDHPAAVGTLVVYDDRLQLVEQQLPGHASKEAKPTRCEGGAHRMLGLD
jgi:hypothetical protein